VTWEPDIMNAAAYLSHHQSARRGGLCAQCGRKHVGAPATCSQCGFTVCAGCYDDRQGSRALCEMCWNGKLIPSAPPPEAEPSMALADDGALEIDLHPAEDTVVQITPWADGLRGYRTRGLGWVAEDEDRQFAFVSAGARAPEGHPLRTFTATVPQDGLALAVRCGTFELTGLRLLRRHPPAWELAADTPNLFWLLAAAIAARRPAPSSAEELLRRKRTDILGWCVGRPVMPAALRFVERIVPEAHGQAEASVLVRAVRSHAVVRLFAHQAAVPVEALHLALAHRSVRNLPAFLDLATRADGDMKCTRRESAELMELHQDISRMARDTDVPPEVVDRLLARCRTVEHVRALHDRWMERQAARDQRRAWSECASRYKDVVFPEPPLADTDGIVFIRQPADLAREGWEMGHCVGSYIDECVKGRSFIYRVLAPARATLELQCWGGRPQLMQLRGPRNAAVGADVQAAVEAWMGRCTDPEACPRTG
jgi:hypothetical protein